MHFVHGSYQPGETIAAVATPPGEGGIAVIRISGSDAIAVADRVFSGSVDNYISHTAHYGRIVDLEGDHVDDALVLVMRAPRSYTGDDVVELHCHGGTLITRKVLEVVLAAGARQALPGEFTCTAFLNGKLDLAQAEAVQTLIAAKNERALEAAEDQLSGRLSKQVGDYQQRLTHAAAILEAWVDFPDEGLEFATMDELCSQIRDIQVEIQHLVDSYHDGKVMHDGVSLCLAGLPNVGKSSLMNALLDRDRAIVSSTPGTTRDCVEDTLRLGGLHLRVIDTAGVREGAEEIEREGIRRSHQAMASADVVAVVLDASRPLVEEEYILLQELPQERTVVAWNKVDIGTAGICSLATEHVVQVSAKARTGLDVFGQVLTDLVWRGAAPDRQELVITNSRHHQALRVAAEACGRVCDGLDGGVSPEFLAADMRQALMELGKVIGTNISEDVLSEIFATFCVGK